MSGTWVSFSAVKSAVSMRMVIEHYGVRNLKSERGELVGRCPIHKGDGDRAFHVNYTKNCFQCFSCKHKGNVLDFVAAMEQCSVRGAALKLNRWFHVPAPPESHKIDDQAQQGEGGKGDFVGDDNADVSSGEEGSECNIQNKPLGFALKGIDHAHLYLSRRGIQEDLAQNFGIGYFSGKGMMHGRIVIPIRNPEGKVVAYAGRAIDGSEPKYKFPPGFHKSSELFNLDSVLVAVATEPGANTPPLVIVEGFFGCLNVWRAGFLCVAVMGNTISRRQIELIAERFERVVVMFDGDDAGIAATSEASLSLARRCFVKIVDTPVGRQVDELSTPELVALLSSEARLP